MKKIIAALAGLLAFALPGTALAQCSGIFAAGSFCGNSAASGGLAGAATPTAMFDRAFGGTNNSTIVRLSGVWTVLSSANNGVWITSAAGVPSISSTLPNAVQDNITRLGTIANVGAPIGGAFGGTGNGFFAVSGPASSLKTFAFPNASATVLTTNAAVAVAQGGTNCAVASGTCLDNITAFSSTGIISRTGAGTYTFSTESALLDVIGSTRGSVLYRGVAGWAALTPGASGQVFTSNGAGADPAYAPPSATISATITPQHRITLASATPVMTSSQAAKTTVFVTPYAGNLIPIYDGSNFAATAFAETSQATTDTTKSPAAVAASSVYDIFCWVDSGTNRCTRGPVWTNTTTRSAGTALVSVNGLWLNNASITNGPAASRGTYVGSVCSDGSSQINYVFGAAASGGTAANLCVWNAYNRVSTGTTVTDNGATYAYTTATVRQARASAGNQVSFLLGLSEDAVSYSYTSGYNMLAAVSARMRGGVGFDVTNAFSKEPFYCRNPSTNFFECAGSTAGQWLPGIGVHILAAVETGDGTNANVFDLDSNATLDAIIRN